MIKEIHRRSNCSLTHPDKLLGVGFQGARNSRHKFEDPFSFLEKEEKFSLVLSPLQTGREKSLKRNIENQSFGRFKKEKVYGGGESCFREAI